MFALNKEIFKLKRLTWSIVKARHIKMKNIWIFLLVIAFVLSVTVVAHSTPQTWKEIKDAGELIDTAQVTKGAKGLNYISGELTGYNDVDMYQIHVDDSDAFSVNVWADLSVDNDATLFLFDLEGYLALSDDDDGSGFLPQFNPGEMSGIDTGLYFLAIDLYMTEPISDPLAGWTSTPAPQQEGPYILSLTGASSAIPSPVSEPATMLLLGSGLVGLAVFGRKKIFNE